MLSTKYVLRAMQETEMNLTYSMPLRGYERDKMIRTYIIQRQYAIHAKCSANKIQDFRGK